MPAGPNARIVKRFGGLAGQGAAGGVGDGAGDHDRQFHPQRFEFGFHRKSGGLGVQGIEDGFDHDQIDAAFHQRASRFAVSRHQFIERDVAERRIVDVRRDGRSAVGRPQHPGDVARFFRRARRPFVGAGARQTGGLIVNLGGQRLHVVVGHGDGGGVEGIGLKDIGARLKIGVMNGGDHFRLGQHQQIVIAFQIAAPVGETLTAKIALVQAIALDHGAHAAVQH